MGLGKFLMVYHRTFVFLGFHPHWYCGDLLYLLIDSTEKEIMQTHNRITLLPRRLKNE